MRLYIFNVFDFTKGAVAMASERVEVIQKSKFHNNWKIYLT